MLSLAAVFKDILPGYRVRLPTEKELAMPVSKEVKKMRDYESALLRSYQVRPCSLIVPFSLLAFSPQDHRFSHGAQPVTNLGQGRPSYKSAFLVRRCHVWQS